MKLFTKYASLAALLLAPALHAADGEALLKGSDCLSCHAINRKVVGPAYLDVAKKYKGANGAVISKLVKKVKNGGSGNWGAIPMAAHASLSDGDIEAMVKYILSLKPEAAAAPVAKAAAAPAAPAAAPAKKEEGAKKFKKHAASHLRSESEGEELLFGTDEQVRELMVKQDCYGCHAGARRDGVAEEMPWPSFAKIEGKLKGKNQDAVVKKVRLGEGALSYGKVPHPAFEQLPTEAVQKMVAYIAEGKSTKGVEVKDPNKMDAEEWMRKGADCFSCHAVGNKVIGPAYRDVAKKYAGASAAQVATLVKKVKMGGAGNWGNVAMSAHPNASDAQLEKAVRWVLSQK